jgi:hypothetical protein
MRFFLQFTTVHYFPSKNKPKSGKNRPSELFYASVNVCSKITMKSLPFFNNVRYQTPPEICKNLNIGNDILKNHTYFHNNILKHL